MQEGMAGVSEESMDHYDIVGKMFASEDDEF
jgi:hypothetical protein